MDFEKSLVIGFGPSCSSLILFHQAIFNQGKKT